MKTIPPVQVHVSGEFALFTRPEFKAERVSYHAPTPSAARGILEAIFFKPEFYWRVREIQVLNPIRTASIRRNEINSKQSHRIQQPYYANHDRSQRNSVVLCDVAYVLTAEALPKNGRTEDQIKFHEMFNRRVRNGQCFHRPALGCREFAAEFQPCDESIILNPNPQIPDQDLGLMLWDLDYSSAKPPFQPLFFHAQLKMGAIAIPNSPIGVRS